MKFTEIQEMALFRMWAKRRNISIKGINAVGEEFEVVGRVSTKDDGDRWIESDAVMIEFGEEVEKLCDESRRGECYAPFRLNFTEQTREAREGLFILEIFEILDNKKGIRIFKNDDEEQLRKTAEEVKQEILDEQTSSEDSVVSLLKNMIGKPVYIDGQPKVVLSVEGHSVTVSKKGTLMERIEITEDTVIELMQVADLSSIELENE